ncbi:hypothetical protein FOZG_17475 [Fusarium oxysporum Fo47]|uniref:chitinase n=1 Tax=Fusarium oxysporum Fo47 TaxID=660027 RepID=W9JH48_FUSOX|nr:hypothetical protein FOZG_17475 [Fusarium oxysporum Fo47]
MHAAPNLVTVALVQIFVARIALLGVMRRVSAILVALAPSLPTIPSALSTSALPSMATVALPRISAERKLSIAYLALPRVLCTDPSDIPDGVYTHINFAFASIDPKTFQIIPASSKDPQLYRELARKKKIDPNLKIFIAIGGWAFNDPGPTITTFSDIARSDANTRTFIKSLISFISTYDFDGVDIDWEYPAADDREGREEDFDNLPKFLSKIKSALKQSGGRSGLSIAIPASYWYLQHFDLEKISKYVDHFNVMTYDLHGAWDTPKSWLGNHLNSHTNLTEIKDAFDLLWRNNIDPDQVNMGLAFYARTFTASSTGCMSTGCLFDAGGPAEPCTNAVGVMSNPEIMRKLGGKIGSGDLDKTAAIKTVKIGSTWLTYDDVDTWKLKLDFARS